MEETKKSFKILGFSIWRLFAYFILYSVIGYIVEEFYSVITTGVVESRKSFLYGPFCAIYGVGSLVMLLGLNHLKKSKITLFFGGFLVGAVVEYMVSFIGELIFNIKWWDYSNQPFNINGRICVLYSFFWGVLAICLICYINPRIDKFIDYICSKFKKSILKTITLITIIAMFIDFLITGFALTMFYARIVDKYDLKNEQNHTLSVFLDLYNKNQTVKDIVDIYFNDEMMIKSFPHLRYSDSNGNIVYLDSFFPEIQTYYIRLFTPKSTTVGPFLVSE